MTRTEVDFEELRWYVKQVFEEEYGINSVVKVEAAQYNPYMINITVYIKEKKAEMRDLCVKIAHVLKSQGIRAGLRTELIQE
jgi:phage-related protein